MTKARKITKFAILSFCSLVLIFITVFFGAYYRENPFKELTATETATCFSFGDKSESVVTDAKLIARFVEKLKACPCVKAKESDLYSRDGVDKGMCSFTFGETFFILNDKGVCMVGGPLAPKYYRLLFFDDGIYYRFVQGAQKKS